MSGEVVSIHIAPKAEADMVAVGEIRAIEGKGLEGDRYAEKIGTWTDTPGSGREVTLIASEEIDAIAADGIRIGPGESRRNITTRGVALNELVDKTFRVGDVVLVGTRLCEPCVYVEGKMGQEGVLKALTHRGGLRCDIVSGGVIRIGDAILV